MDDVLVEDVLVEEVLVEEVLVEEVLGDDVLVEDAGVPLGVAPETAGGAEADRSVGCGDEVLTVAR